jgi:hypothetical protein
MWSTYVFSLKVEEAYISFSMKIKAIELREGSSYTTTHSLTLALVGRGDLN